MQTDIEGSNLNLGPVKYCVGLNVGVSYDWIIQNLIADGRISAAPKLVDNDLAHLKLIETTPEVAQLLSRQPGIKLVTEEVKVPLPPQYPRPIPRNET